MYASPYPFRTGEACAPPYRGDDYGAVRASLRWPRGVERYQVGTARARHRHFRAHASVVLETGFLQTGYAGRFRLEPGDILIQPTLDRHHSRTFPDRAARVLHLPWQFEPGLGGVHRVSGLDAVVREAWRDPWQSSALLADLIGSAAPESPPIWDWPDLLAGELRKGPVEIAEWSMRHGLARESVARGFHRTFGVSPTSFACELRARRAWLRVIGGRDSLAGIAADTGFADQSHMTRAIHTLTGAPPDAWRRRLPVSGEPGCEHRCPFDA